MVNYRRSRVAGGTFFVTVHLFDRRKTILLDHVDLLRRIVIDVKTKLPLVIDATVVLPDHWHAVAAASRCQTRHAAEGLGMRAK